MSTSIVFKGRSLIPGRLEKAKALVTQRGFNTLASFYPTLAQQDAETAICGDLNNKDTYGKVLTGVALCLPTTVGSTSAGSTWEYVARRGLAPAALLFSRPADSLATAGLIVAAVWNDNPVIIVDCLGADLLRIVQTDNTIAIVEDGTVSIDRT